MPPSHIDQSTVTLFLKSWQVYQQIIRHNYMFHQEIGESVQAALLDLQPGRKLNVLDLGCGDASMALPLLSPDRIAVYTGCDLSQPALDIARQQLSALQIEHQLICDDMTHMIDELSDASIDLVFSSYAIHHLNAIHKQRMVEEIARVLSPSGRFVLIDIFRNEGPWDRGDIRPPPAPANMVTPVGCGSGSSGFAGVGFRPVTPCEIRTLSRAVIV